MKQNVLKPDGALNLRLLPEESRHSLVISSGRNGLVLSRHGDHVWNLSPHIHTRNKAASSKIIDFSSPQFADGSRLTDPQHVGLLESVKALLYVRLSQNSPHSGKPLSAITAIGLWMSLCPLLRWMVDAGYGSFASLTSEACLAYVSIPVSGQSGNILQMVVQISSSRQQRSTPILFLSKIYGISKSSCRMLCRNIPGPASRQARWLASIKVELTELPRQNRFLTG